MMKKLLFLLILLPALVSGQIKNDDSGNIYFEQVYEVDLSQPEIKNRVNEWIALNFNDSNNVIKMNTDDQIITNGIFKISLVYEGGSTPMNINFSMITEFKEGRYRILINNILMDNTSAVKDIEMLTFENFKKQYQKSSAHFTGQAKRISDKFQKNEKKMRDLYEQGLGSHQNIVSQVKEKISAMTSDLSNHVSDPKDNSDW